MRFDASGSLRLGVAIVRRDDSEMQLAEQDIYTRARVVMFLDVIATIDCGSIRLLSLSAGLVSRREFIMPSPRG